jgi:hypothetical protein
LPNPATEIKLVETLPKGPYIAADMMPIAAEMIEVHMMQCNPRLLGWQGARKQLLGPFGHQDPSDHLQETLYILFKW